MKTSDREKLTLRLPADIHAKLTAEAENNDRSLNSEIVSRLRASLAAYKR